MAQPNWNCSKSLLKRTPCKNQNFVQEQFSKSDQMSYVFERYWYDNALGT